MEDEAKARAERLAAMKERAKRAREGGGEGDDSGPKIKFRNYQPKTADLKEAVLPPVKLTTEEDVSKLAAPVSVDVQLDVAPKKANWDLKRDIAKKLEKLERRTQQAIVEMIKQKVAEGAEGEEESGKMLAAAVSAQGGA